MTIYLYIIIGFLWVLMGLSCLMPYLQDSKVAEISIFKKIFAIILFILLAPLIALSTIVPIVIYFYFYGESPPEDMP